MKIKSSSNAYRNPANGRDARGERHRSGETGATAPSSSTVSLSSMSSLATMSNVGDIDTAKVEVIKAALRNGTYQIDSAKIADGMIGSVRELLQAKVG